MSIEEKAGYPVYPNLKQMWELFGIFILASLGTGLVHLALVSGFKYFSFPSEVNEWLGFPVYVATMVMTILYAKNASCSTDFDYGFVAEKSSARLFLTLIFFVPAMIVINDRTASYIPMPEAVEKMFADMVHPNFPSFLTVVVAAPILEELLCRGVVLRGLMHNMPPAKAILWSALFFAILHLNPWQGVAAFIVGSISGWIFWKTKSIIPCIFLHLLNNGIGFVMIMIFDDPMSSISELFDGYYPYVLVFSLAVFHAGLYVIYRICRKTENRNIT